MPIAVQCPGCNAKLNAPDAAAGKRLKCPKCAGTITVPAPAPSFEVVDEPDVPAEPPPAKQPVRAEAEPEAAPPKRAKRTEEDRDDEADEDAPRKKKQRDEDDEAAEAPRKKKRRDEDDETEEPPKKRRGADAELEDDDRPRKKKRRDEDETAGSGLKKKWLFIGGGAAVLLVGIVLAIVLSQSGSSGNKADNKDNKDNKDGTPVVADDLKVIAPRTTFTADFGKAKDSEDLSYGPLYVTNGGDVVVATRTDPQVQAWSTLGEPKKRWEKKGRAEWLSMDGASLGLYGAGVLAVDVASGEPTDVSASWTNTRAVQTKLGRFDWGRGSSGVARDQFLIDQFEVLPSIKQLEPVNAGDDGFVVVVPAVKQGAELVFGLPRKNKVRVFDFAKKAVTREFTLSNPRVLNTTAWSQGYAPWRGFGVSTDGKWIYTRRWYSGREPDPIEIFDATGTRVATLPAEGVNEVSGAFIPGRDLYIAAVSGPVKGTNFRAGDILVFDINKRAFLAGLRSEQLGTVTRIAISPDGKSLAAGAAGGQIAVWDLTKLP